MANPPDVQRALEWALERTAAGAQAVIPGASRDLAGLAKQRAAAPLKPKKPQEPCDVGLFSDDAKQLDLL